MNVVGVSLSTHLRSSEVDLLHLLQPVARREVINSISFYTYNETYIDWLDLRAIKKSIKQPGGTSMEVSRKIET